MQRLRHKRVGSEHVAARNSIWCVNVQVALPPERYCHQFVFSVNFSDDVCGAQYNLSHAGSTCAFNNKLDESACCPYTIGKPSQISQVLGLVGFACDLIGEKYGAIAALPPLDARRRAPSPWYDECGLLLQ